MGREATRRVNVIFPISLLDELQRHVPQRQRNRFIIRATEEELRREKLLLALKKSTGAWSDEDHPDLMTVEDLNRYVRQLRETWTPLPWDRIAEGAEPGD